jgi:hypothetical protein
MLAGVCFALPSFASRPITSGGGDGVRASVPSSIGVVVSMSLAGGIKPWPMPRLQR